MKINNIVSNVSSSIIFDNFSYSLTLIIFSVLFLVSFLLAEHSSLEVSGIAAESGAKSKTPIKHVIVISQGKRSFDNYFGTFPGANGFPTNLTVPLNPTSQDVKNFSVATWFKTNNTMAVKAFLINKGGFGVDTPGMNMNYGIWMAASAQIKAGFETISGADQFVSTVDAYNDGEWHHVVVTNDGSSLRLYIDGVQVDTKSTVGAIPESSGTKPLRVGANSLVTPPSDFFTGEVDEVRIWSDDLTTQEVADALAGTSFNNAEQVLYIDYSGLSATR